MSNPFRAVGPRPSQPLPPPGFRPVGRALRVLEGHRLVWVEAPGGFGKTSHVAHFARALEARDGTPYAWLALDPDDRDPIGLLQDLGDAIALAWPDFTIALDPRPTAPTTAWYRFGRHLAARLGRLGSFLLVLDDVHRLDDSDGALAVVEALVQAAPADLRLVLISQGAPPRLPVARWLGEGRVARLGPDDLRLDAADVRHLLSPRMGDIPPALARSLADATGGWPLVVRLLAERLGGRAPTEADLADLKQIAAVGDDLHRYMVGAILGDLPDQAQRDLLVLAVPEEVEPALADVLLRGRGPGVYAGLVGAPWFAPVAPGSAVVRLHPLVRDVLLREAERRLGQRALRVLHRRLAAFWAARRLWAAGVDHALRAGAWDTATAMLDRAVADELGLGHGARVRAWLDALEAAGRADTGPVLLGRAHLAALAGDHVLAWRLTERARTAYAARDDAQGAAACLALCALHLELRPTAEVWRSARSAEREVPAAARGWARLWRFKLAQARGRGAGTRAIEGAVAAIEEGLPLDPNTPKARAVADHLHYLAGAVGSIRASASVMVRALAWQTFDYWPALLYAGRWDELAALLEEATTLAVPTWRAGFVATWLELPRAVLLALHGDAIQALAHVEAAARALEPAWGVTPSWPLEQSVLRAVQVGCLVRTGQLEAAERVARANLGLLGGSPTMAPVGHLDLVQVLLRAGRTLEAAVELERAQALAAEVGLRGLYARTLRLALTLATSPPADGREALVSLLGEIERKGAYGLWPMYDSGAIEAALADLDDGALPPALATAARRVRALFARARSDGAVGALSARVPVRLQTLGRFAWRGGAADSRLPSGRVAELLLRLLWAGERGLGREVLAEAIWPEAAADEQANRLRVTLHALRRWLETALGAGDGPAAHVEADRLQVRLTGAEALAWDVTALQSEMRYARSCQEAGETTAVLHHARAAVDLYQGEFLPDPAWYEAFALERQALEREHVAFVEWVVGALGAEHPDVTALLERAVRASPGEESLQRLWLESLVRQGRMAEARRALKECAVLLDTHLGQAPPEEWLRLVHGGERGPARRPSSAGEAKAGGAPRPKAHPRAAGRDGGRRSTTPA